MMIQMMYLMAVSDLLNFSSHAGDSLRKIHLENLSCSCIKELLCAQFLGCFYGTDKINGKLEDRNCKMLGWKKK